MDADSSYGGSDTAQDSHSGHDNSSSLDTTHNDVTTTVHDADAQQEQEPNNFYHKNEITLPVNCDEADFQENKSTKQPHYLSTANLNINDTLEHHSNLEEMSKNYKSTSYLNESPRIRKKNEEGVDNPAFQEEEYKPEVKSTFDNNKPYNGDLNSSTMLGLTSPNKNEEPLTEAVNLELINLKPVGKDVTGAYENGNGMTSIPVKKENEAEIGNPYDEYFVPVNEHRKYMRGEKLYVTMDKRNKKKRNKCLCWGLCLCIVAAAVIIGILAAVGIIGNQGPQPLHEVSARHFGGSSSDEPQIKKGGVFGLPKDIINETTTPSEPPTQRFTPGPPLVTVPSMLPTTETSMIQVPRALESQLVIDNLQFTPELADKNSDEYKKLAAALETEIKQSLFSSDILNYGAADIEVKVMDFAAGSVVVKYRITWVFKNGIHNAKDPIDEEMLKRKVRSMVENNNGFMNSYHVSGNTVTVEKILDLCKIDNNGCEHNCSFDYTLADFVCLCPEGKYLGQDQKSCIDEPLEHDDVHFNEHHYHTHTNPEPEPSAEPEPTAEPEPEPTHDHNEHDHDHEYHTTVKPEPEPSSEPKPEPPANKEHYDHLEHNPLTTKPEPEPEPTSKPEPEPTSEPEPEPAKDYEHDHHHHLYVPVVETEPTSEPVTEYKVQEQPGSTFKPEDVSHENYVNVHGTEVPSAEPTAEPTTEHHIHEIKHISVEETSEPNAEPTTMGHMHNIDSVEAIAEPAAEPSAEPTAEPAAEPSAEPTAEPAAVPSAEPTAEPSAEPTVQPEMEHSNEHYGISKDGYGTPEPEPTSEPVAVHEVITTTKSAVEHMVEPTAEPAPEPTSEPVAEPTSIPDVIHLVEHAENSTHQTGEHVVNPAEESTAEPTPEPSSGEKAENSPATTLRTEMEHSTEMKIEDKNIVVPLVPLMTVTTTAKPESEMNTEINIQAFDSVTNASTTVNTTESILSSTPASEIITVSPSTYPQISTSEASTNFENEIHVSVSSTEFVSPITTTTTESSFRHNHLLHEILAETETTTLGNNLQGASSTESVNSSDANSVLNTLLLDSHPNETDTMAVVTTQLPLTETSTKATTEENLLIPVSVNGTPQVVVAHTSTEQVEDHTNAIPVYVNDKPVVVHSDSVDIYNTTEKKLEETTTPQADLTKILTDLHNHHIHSSEAMNNTHMMDSTENTSAMDNMSPFLPEIDNDTFVNKLHLGEHVIPHMQNETHEEDLGGLNNDQINETNPQDSNPNENSLNVVPIEGNENEILHTVTVTQATIPDQEVKQTETHVVPVLVGQEEIVTTTSKQIPEEEISTDTQSIPVVVSQNTTTADEIPEVKDVTDAQLIPVVVSQEPVPTTTPIPQVVVSQESNQTGASVNETNTFATTIPPLEDKLNVTLPPEIINNVHSNNYFDNLEKTVTEKTMNQSTTTENNNTNELNTSTEDLIALETTTHGEKIGVTAVATATEVPDSNKTAATIHAEIVDTVTETIHFDSNNATNLTQMNPEQVMTTIMPAVTTMVTAENASHGYEVNEAFADVTTTEKLFIAVKVATESPVVTQSEDEDLSVVPLIPEEDDKTSKDKRVVHDTTHQLDSDSNSVNDITGGDLDKFGHNLNDIHEASADSTSSKYAESSTELTRESTKSDESKLKKSYYDKEKPKYEKKVKLEKSVLTEEDLFTAAVDDKQPHPFSDIRPVTEEFADLARCAYGQFGCVNGTAVKDGSYCIPENDRCDSVRDCSDGSDEIDCIKNGCPNNYQCASGQCLKRHLVCDGIQNCNDGSDEIGCEHWQCRSDEFSCGQGQRCLPVHWKCDNRAQCADGSDEHHCPTTCHESNFYCTEQMICLPMSWRCDGHSDCLNDEDERSCECANDELKCAMGGGCVKKAQACDGVPQCADNSDEWNCLRLEKEVDSKKYLEVKESNTTWYPVCSDNWNQTYSNLICQEMGYGGASSTDNVNKTENSSVYFKLASDLKYGLPVLSQLVKTDQCDSLVSISCQEFECGSHSTLEIQSPRINGANPGTEIQWPSLTLLYNKRFNLKCTSTLIAPMWVIASYSCIFDSKLNVPTIPREWMLYAGSTNFFSNADNSTTQISGVKRLVPHPQAKYSQFEYSDDLVLVELSQPLAMTRNVTTMCLPETDIEPRQLCVVVGWGVNKPGESSTIQYLPVPTINSSECNSTKHYNGLMGKDKICAGYTESDKSPCHTDEGVPLLCFSDSAGTWELQGVLSHHDNCAQGKHPAIYTSINERMRKWILNTIGHKPARSA